MGLYEFYNYLIYDLGDPQWKGAILIETPWPTLTIAVSYFYFVKVFGPKFMENRQPFKIEGLMIFYNIIQILWNLYMASFVYDIIYAVSTMENISLWCLPISYFEEEPLSKLLHYGCKLYYTNKIFDFLDTVFFVFRKKFHQITFLHVYHHLFMVVAGWPVIKYLPGGNNISAGIANSLVHVMMYTYYLLTALGYDVWWKKYLTQLQIVQFSFALIHNLAVFFQKDCQYNFVLSSFSALQCFVFIYMFSSFYIKSYQKKDKKKN